MPSKTFLNLPQAKRERILAAARQEFTQYPFESAKVTRICVLADIPRVTFYSYFESLHDIYQYLYDELRCEPDGNTDIEQCQQQFNNFEHQIQFFISLIQSRRGIRKMSQDMANESAEIRLSWNLSISLALQYDVGSLTLEQLYNEYKELAKLYQSS